MQQAPLTNDTIDDDNIIEQPSMYLLENTDTKIDIDADEAFADLAELARYALLIPELSVEVCRLLNEGTPGFDCEIDSGPTVGTDSILAHYKLPKRFREWLVALRAGEWQPDKIDCRSSERGFGD
jgi:hypothetical protein